MAGTIDLIRDWATELAYWEQAALEIVASGTAPEEMDYEYLLELFMQDAGLAPAPPGERPALTFPIKMDDWQVTGYKVERLFNLRNVNALPAGQELRFGTQLTAIYGTNSAGKTGYSRPFGCAGFARGEHEVLRRLCTSSRPTASLHRIEA